MCAQALGRHPINTALPGPKRMTTEESNWDVKGHLAQVPEMGKDKEGRDGEWGDGENDLSHLPHPSNKARALSRTLLFSSLVESRGSLSVPPPVVTGVPWEGTVLKDPASEG